MAMLRTKRPRLTRKVQAQVDEDLSNRLEAFAEAERRSRSEAVRVLLERALDRAEPLALDVSSRLGA